MGCSYLSSTVGLASGACCGVASLSSEPALQRPQRSPAARRAGGTRRLRLAAGGRKKSADADARFRLCMCTHVHRVGKGPENDPPILTTTYLLVSPP
jgi:hypothetical protein